MALQSITASVPKISNNVGDSLSPSVFIRPEPFVDGDHAALFLSLPKRRLLELARAGTLPAHPVGDGSRKTWRFRLTELASALEARLNSDRQFPAPEGEI
jgi:hypothetical protein